MRIHAMPDRVRVIVNSRVHYEKFIRVGPASRIEVFAEDGAAEFGRIDVWERSWEGYEPRRVANTG